MDGHKDSSGKFHPHSDSFKKLSSHQVENAKDSSVNHNDANDLKNKKQPKLDWEKTDTIRCECGSTLSAFTPYANQIVASCNDCGAHQGFVPKDSQMIQLISFVKSNSRTVIQKHFADDKELRDYALQIKSDLEEEEYKRNNDGLYGGI